MSHLDQDLAQAEQLYQAITIESTHNYADLLIHLLHEYAHAEQLHHMLARHLITSELNASTLSALYEDCAFELFPALATAFEADPTTFTAVSRPAPQYQCS